MTVESEVAVDEAIEIFALPETNGVGSISQPAMELRADSVEVLRFCALFALANFGGVLAT